MTKTQTWAAVQELPEFAKANKALKAALEELLAPKVAASANPPKVDDKGEVTEVWCRIHGQYEPIETAVMSNGKPKGYCGAGISAWNKRNKAIKDQNNQVTELLMDGELEEAQRLAAAVKSNKEALSNPSTYNYTLDVENYNPTSK